MARRILPSSVTRIFGRTTLLAVVAAGAAGTLLAQAQAPAPPAQPPRATVKVAAPKPPETPAATAAVPAEQSLLAGAWKLNWLRQNKVTALNFSNEQGQPGVLGFESALTDLTGAECKGGGFAARSLGGVFPNNGDVNMIGVSDYLRLTAKCPNGQIVLEALGVVGQPLQWVGRAVVIDAAGQRKFESFIATR